MVFTVPKKVPIPSEKETTIKILGIAQAAGCYKEAKAVFDKSENEKRTLKFDDFIGREKIAMELIKSLYNVDFRLVAWLVNEDGKILVNNKVALDIADSAIRPIPKLIKL